MKATLHWIFFSALVIVTACHKRTDVGPEYNSVSRIVGPAGKKIDIFYSDGTTRVATIDIPPGALDKEVEVGVTLKVGYPGLVVIDSLWCYSSNDYGEYWEFSPKGLSFKKPVTINLVSSISEIKFFSLINPLGDNLNPDNWRRKQEYTYTHHERANYQFTDTVLTSYFIPMGYLEAYNFYINGIEYEYTQEGPYFDNGYYFVLYKHEDEETQVIFAEPPLPNKKYKIYNSYDYDFMPSDKVDYCMIRQYDGDEEYLSVSGEITYRYWLNEYGSSYNTMLSNNVLLRNAPTGKEKRIMGYSAY